MVESVQQGGEDFRLPDDFSNPGDWVDDETGEPSLVTGKDAHYIIPDSRKQYLDPTDAHGYWLVEGYSYALIYRSRRDNDKHYFVIEPYITEEEQKLISFLDDELNKEIDHSQISLSERDSDFTETLQIELQRLLKRQGLADNEIFKQDATDRYSNYNSNKPTESPSGITGKVFGFFSGRMLRSKDEDDEDEGEDEDRYSDFESHSNIEHTLVTDVEESLRPLSPRQVDVITYYLLRDYVGYGKIHPLMNDPNIEDISVTGYNSCVHVSHATEDEIKTNVRYGTDDLDATVSRFAEMDGQGISKRQPQVNATLPDGSRAQLTLGTEVSEGGSNFTIRRFRDVPFTPIDLISWGTCDIEMMAYLWLAVEHGRSVMFSGGTSSGKTTSLNAASLFIPKKKVVSIEDTPELELPQDNWVQETTREHQRSGGMENYDESDLLVEALRQNPTYIVMGEIRDQEAIETFFEANNTGHTTMTTFHADDIPAVINRITGEQTNLGKPQFAELDLVCLQREIVKDGQRQRRITSLTELGSVDDDGEVEYEHVFGWNPGTDTFEKQAETSILADIKWANGWSDQELAEEIYARQLVLAYLIRNGIQRYEHVAGVIQGAMLDIESVLHLIATDQLERYLDNLADLDLLDISVTEDDEEEIIRPTPDPETFETADRLLAEHNTFLQQYENHDIGQVFQSDFDESEEISSIAEVDDHRGESVSPTTGVHADDDDEFDLWGDDTESDIQEPDEDLSSGDIGLGGGIADRSDVDDPTADASSDTVEDGEEIDAAADSDGADEEPEEGMIPIAGGDSEAERSAVAETSDKSEGEMASSASSSDVAEEDVRTGDASEEVEGADDEQGDEDSASGSGTTFVGGFLGGSDSGDDNSTSSASDENEADVDNLEDDGPKEVDDGEVNDKGGTDEEAAPREHSEAGDGGDDSSDGFLSGILGRGSEPSDDDESNVEDETEAETGPLNAEDSEPAQASGNLDSEDGSESISVDPDIQPDDAAAVSDKEEDPSDTSKSTSTSDSSPLESDDRASDVSEETPDSDESSMIQIDSSAGVDADDADADQRSSDTASEVTEGDNSADQDASRVSDITIGFEDEEESEQSDEVDEEPAGQDISNDDPMADEEVADFSDETETDSSDASGDVEETDNQVDEVNSTTESEDADSSDKNVDELTVDEHLAEIEASDNQETGEESKKMEAVDKDEVGAEADVDENQEKGSEEIKDGEIDETVQEARGDEKTNRRETEEVEQVEEVDEGEVDEVTDIDEETEGVRESESSITGEGEGEADVNEDKVDEESDGSESPDIDASEGGEIKEDVESQSETESEEKEGESGEEPNPESLFVDPDRDASGGTTVGGLDIADRSPEEIAGVDNVREQDGGEDDSTSDSQAEVKSATDTDTAESQQTVDDNAKSVGGVGKYEVHDDPTQIKIDPEGCQRITETVNGYQQCPFPPGDEQFCPQHLKEE